MEIFTFQTTPKIIVELGGLAKVGRLMRGLDVRQALVICDPGIAACGFAGRATDALSQEGIQAYIFDAVEADPPVKVVRRAVKIARAFGVDGIIGLGGGSSLDTAKIVSLLANVEALGSQAHEL